MDDPLDAALRVIFGHRLRNFREDRGMTQEELAEAVGLSRASIANMEAGRQDPPVTMFWKLSRTLGHGMDDFF